MLNKSFGIFSNSYVWRLSQRLVILQRYLTALKRTTSPLQAGEAKAVTETPRFEVIACWLTTLGGKVWVLKRLKGLSVHIWQCPIHNGTLNSFACSSMNLILMFIRLKIGYFFVVAKVTRAGKLVGIIRVKPKKRLYLPHFWPDKSLKSTVLWIGHSHLCIEGRLN